MWSIPERRGTGATARFVRIADALATDIRRGVRRPGDRLPSTRVLAGELGVNRNTVVAAYDELVAQGWAASRGAAGTFVAAELPDRPVRRGGDRPRGLARRPGYELEPVRAPASPVAPPGARVLLSAGVPDPRLFPRAELARAYRRALRSPAATAALGYADPLGSPRLRAAIAAMLRATRALPVGPEHVMITRGSQMALDLAARALIRPGDVAAVEALGYPPAWRALAAAGARLAAVPLDAHGLEVAAIPPGTRCLYATPHHQYPTTVLLTQARRLALLERAHRDRFAILEDDYDHEFHFDGRPVAPLASADPHGSVIYVGTLSKILAPGLRIGFVAAPEPVIARLAAIRDALDRQGDHVLEHAIAELVEDGAVQRHAHKLRRIYALRREALAELVRRELAGVVELELPAGGITVWARVADDVALERWQARALARGVSFAIARDFALDRAPRPFLRLAFARHDEAELAAAIRVLARALREA